LIHFYKRKFCLSTGATMVRVYHVNRFFILFLSVHYHCEASKLRKIITETCEDTNSFTRNTIYLELYNGDSNPCKASFPYWQWTTRDKKQVKISEGSALGDCQRFENVSSDALRARVVWDHGWGTGWGYDAVQMCLVILEFGDGHRTNEIFIWSGKEWFEGDATSFMKFYKREFYLDRISATVCSEILSATNDAVHLELDDGYMTCRTGIQDTWGDNWSHGITETLKDNVIENCKFLDAKADKLWVRIILYPLKVISYNAIQLCHLEAEFKSYKTVGSKSLVWKGAQWWEEGEFDVDPTYVSMDQIPLDQAIAPNSYSAKMLIDHSVLFSPDVNLKLEDVDKNSPSFDKLSPHMVFRGVNPADPPIIISWSDLKNGHRNGEFHSFVNQTLSKVLRNAKKLVLVTHGFMNDDVEHCQNMWVSVMANKIGTFENGEPKSKQQVPTATVAICWYSSPPLPSWQQKLGSRKLCYLLAKSSRFIYFQHACSTGKMGELLAKLIKAIKDVFSNIEYVHGIGHSLGAHVMGNIYNFGGVKIDRISGLDPAGPCFEGSHEDITIVGREWGVTKNSAFFVDNIHTDGEYLGTYQSKGHLDFFMGDPVYGEQPTCKMGCMIRTLDVCCHGIATEYYEGSINLDEFPRFKTSYLTDSQDETSPSGRTIGPAEPSQVFYAGYHASRNASTPTPPNKNRMYVPIFKVNDMWHPICDPKIAGKNKHWCDNQH